MAILYSIMENNVQKEKIRKEILKKRISLSTEDRINKSIEIFKKLESINIYNYSEIIMFYVATMSEVQTENMIKESLIKGKKIVIPIMESDTGNLVPSLLLDYDNELEKNSQGILESKKAFRRLFSAEKLEVIIIPGIAFDASGNRLGRGKGYYDRFLTRINPSVLKIALAYEIQMVDHIPHDKNDIPVNMIITEQRIIQHFK